MCVSIRVPPLTWACFRGGLNNWCCHVVSPSESLKYNEDPITRSHSNMWRSGLFFADIGRTQAPRVFNYWWLLQRTRSPRWACLYYSKHPPDISKQTEHGNVMCNLKAGRGLLDLVRALVPGKWGADGCTHHSLIHLPSILRCFGTHLLPLSVFFCNMMAPGGDVASSLHKPLFVFQPFFFFLHSHVVLLIQASFSVHYTFHPPWLSSPVSHYEDVDSRNWFQLAALYN